MTYPEWAGKWWAWASSIPADQNPNVDPYGRFFNVGQSGSPPGRHVTLITPADQIVTVSETRGIKDVVLSAGFEA
jgi:hypothetical protein